MTRSGLEARKPLHTAPLSPKSTSRKPSWPGFECDLTTSKAPLLPLDKLSNIVTGCPVSTSFRAA